MRFDDSCLEKKQMQTLSITSDFFDRLNFSRFYFPGHRKTQPPVVGGIAKLLPIYMTCPKKRRR